MKIAGKSTITDRKVFEKFCKVVPKVFSDASEDVEYHDIPRIRYEDDDSTPILEAFFEAGIKYGKRLKK